METIKRNLYVLLMILPLLVFPQHKPTSYDSDGDGIPDSVDKCVLVPGLPQFQGCPFVPMITADDRDGDGVPDVYDACPDMFGVKGNNGCPDLTLINQPVQQPVATSPMGELADNISMYTSTSSSEAEQMNNFKNNLLQVLASSGRMFVDIKTYKDEEANDYKTAVCLAGAKECYVDLTQHFIAGFGNFSVFDAAITRYKELKQNLMLALGEDKWKSNEITEDGMKSFEMTQKTGVSSSSPRVTAFIYQIPGDGYKVYLSVASR